jgi:integrase
MPRRSSGPKLWLDKDRHTWTIVDGRTRHRTGLSAADIKQAERALRDYIESKHKPAEGPNPLLADVLAAYAEEHIAHVVSGKHILYDIGHLNRWWGKKRVTDVSAASTRAYAAGRNAGASARRELAFLNAAIQHWKANHAPMMPTPKIKLPPKPQPRQDFMTRSEAARFLWVARRTPHLARFFLIGWYTGSRRSVITGLKWSMVNLETGIMQRKERGAVRTKKRNPPVRLGARIHAHLRRWARLDDRKTEYVVHYRGNKIDRPVRSWERTRKAAKLPVYVVPHILRHSRATHMLKAGVPIWDAAAALGMSVKVLADVYGHHAPDWQKDAANVR